MISRAVISLLQIPDYYQDDLYLSTMVNFWCIIRRLLDITKPLSICEIGSERGIASSKLASYCANNNSKLSIVDPSGFENIDRSEHVSLYQERSIDFFSRHIPVDFYLIDGGHNYQTVMMELESGLRNNDEKPPVYILHDVSWPCAFRDYYYDYDSYRFKGANPHKSNISIVIDSEDIAEVGIPILEPYSVAVKYGGERNGVLKAVEDFKKKFKPDEWHFWKIPTLFGLGILFNRAGMPKNMVEEITLYLDSLDLFRPLLIVLETNCLRILQSFFELQSHYTTSNQEHTAQKSRADELVIHLKTSDEKNRNFELNLNSLCNWRLSVSIFLFGFRRVLWIII